MQDGKVWILGKRTRLIWKAELDSLADERTARVSEVDDDFFKRKPIRRMYVDPRGLHAFFLAEHEVFYNHWSSPRVFQVQVTQLGAAQQPKAFKSIDLQYVAPREYDLFEILLGTEDGQIFHACLQFSPKAGLETIDALKHVFDTGEYRAILDLKIAKISGNQIVLAITDQTLHQYHSNKNVNLKSTFNEYLSDPQRGKEHTIRIDASHGSNNQREGDEEVSANQLRLYTNGLPQGPDEEAVVGGFGWMNEYGFYYANYNPGEFIIKKKSLEIASYIKKEEDSVVENVLPSGFAITQFHIVYMYPRNVTVLSKISRQIVHSCTIRELETLSGIVLDQRRNMLLLHGKAAPLMIANLRRGEDQDAWRYYLHREQFVQAINACKNGKQRAFAAGFYADHLFSKEKFDSAADYYSQSDKTFEEVALKFL